jgi:hypothetical protein
MAPDNDADEPRPGRGDPGTSETRHHPPHRSYPREASQPVGAPQEYDMLRSPRRRRWIRWLLVAFVLAVLLGILAGLWPDVPWIRN